MTDLLISKEKKLCGAARIKMANDNEQNGLLGTGLTLAAIMGGGALGYSLLKDPDTFQKLFGQTTEEVSNIREALDAARKTKAEAKKIDPFKQNKMQRLEILGKEVSKYVQPIIQNDIDRNFRAGKANFDWNKKFGANSTIFAVMENGTEAEKKLARETLLDTTRVMLNTPTLGMKLVDIENRMELLNNKADKDLLTSVASLYNQIEKEYLPDHQRRSFRETFIKESKTQRNYLKGKIINRGYVKEAFKEWIKENPEKSGRKFYKPSLITRTNDGETGAEYIINEFNKKNIRNGRQLSSREAQIIKENYDRIYSVYKKATGRPLNYKVTAIEDLIRGGDAIMMRVSLKGSPGKGGTGFYDIPLLANRGATFGHYEKSPLENSLGAITYEASGRRGYQSAIAMPGEILDLKGSVRTTEQLIIRQFEEAINKAAHIDAKGNVQFANNLEMERIKKQFIEKTTNSGQRLTPWVNGPQAAVAVQSTYKVIVNAPNFELGNQEQIKFIGENPNLKILDLAPGAIRGDMRVYQANAPTIESQIIGMHRDTTEILPTDKTASFNKTIALSGGPVTYGNADVTLPARESRYDRNQRIKEFKEKRGLRTSLDDIKKEREEAIESIKNDVSLDEKTKKTKIREATTEANKKVKLTLSNIRKEWQDAEKTNIEAWKVAKAQAVKESENALNSSFFVGYDMNNPTVLATQQNKRFLPIVYQDGILDAHFRTQYRMGEGLYLGKTYGFTSDSSTLRNLSDVDDAWKAVWEISKKQDMSGKGHFVSIARLKKMGLAVGRNNAGNVMKINLRGTNIKGIRTVVNPTTGDLIYRTVYNKGELSKAKGMGVKGQITGGDPDIILRETAHALGNESAIDAAQKIIGKKGNAIIADMDQVTRGVFAMKEATVGGSALLLSNKDKNTWKGHINTFLNSMAATVGTDGKLKETSLTDYSKGLYNLLRSEGVAPEEAAFNIRGAFNMIKESELKKNAGESDADYQARYASKWEEFFNDASLTPEQLTYNEKAAQAAAKQRGFLGGGTLAFDTTSELGGAGKMASIERRGLHSILINLENAGLNPKQQARVMGDIMNRMSRTSPGNWMQTYETMAASFFSIQKPEELESLGLLDKISKRGNIIEIDLMGQQAKQGTSMLDMLDEKEFKNAHLVKLNLKGTTAEKIIGKDHIYIPGGAGTPDIEKVNIKKDNAKVQMIDEFTQARNNFLKILNDPTATEDQIGKELFLMRSQMAQASAEIVRHNTTGKVAGSAMGRFLTLMTPEYKDKQGKWKRSGHIEKMLRLAEKDAYQTMFVQDAVFLQQAKGLKQSLGNVPKGELEEATNMVKEQINRFFFAKKGEGYNVGFFSRNPTLSEGHGILTKQRRYISDDVNEYLFDNKEIRKILNSYNEAGKEISLNRKFIQLINEEGLFKDPDTARKVKKQITDIIYDDLSSLHKKAIDRYGASMYTPMSDDPLSYRLKQSGASAFKEEQSKKIYYSRAYRSIGDSDGDVTTMILLGDKEADRLAGEAMGKISNAQYANMMMQGDVEFDVMNKRIALTQAATTAANTPDPLNLTERMSSFIKNIYAKNVGNYSIAIDTLKSAVLSDETLTAPGERRRYADLLLSMEENILKAKKLKGKIENLGEIFAKAVFSNSKESYREILEKRVAKWSDIDIIEFNNKTIEMKYGEMFDNLWNMLQRYKRSGGGSARNLKGVYNAVMREGSDTEEAGDSMARSLKKLEEGRSSLINAVVNPNPTTPDIESLMGSPSVAAPSNAAANAAGDAMAGANAATAADAATSSVPSGEAPTGIRRLLGELSESITDKLKSTSPNRNYMIAGGALAMTALGIFAGQSSNESLEEVISLQNTPVVPRDKLMQQETYLQQETGRANVMIQDLSSLPGVANALSASGIRKQSMIIQDNRPPITKNQIDRRER